MKENTCCGSKELDQTEAVENRYTAAAHKREECLCSPVSFNPDLLKAIPLEIIEKDYGCGNPTEWLIAGDHVLDLGSGSGKNAFIASQIVGESGRVIGIDRNDEMIELARQANKTVAKNIGYSNVTFIQSGIASIHQCNQGGGKLVEDKSIDIVISNCVLNLVNFSERDLLLNNIKRVLKENGRISISDIVADKPIPLTMQKNEDLWSGCISGAWEESELIASFKKQGFKNVMLAKREENPWKIINEIEFRSVTLVARL